MEEDDEEERKANGNRKESTKKMAWNDYVITYKQ